MDFFHMLIILITAKEFNETLGTKVAFMIKAMYVQMVSAFEGFIA